MTSSPSQRRPWVSHWGDDPLSFNLWEEGEDGIDVEGSGMPGRELVAGAVLFWLRDHPEASAETVAQTFNLGTAFALDVMRPDLFNPCDPKEAIQVWSLLLGGDVRITTASAMFNLDPGLVVDMIEEHPWMYIQMIAGVPCVGHEGE